MCGHNEYSKNSVQFGNKRKMHWLNLSILLLLYLSGVKTIPHGADWDSESYETSNEHFETIREADYYNDNEWAESEENVTDPNKVGIRELRDPSEEGTNLCRDNRGCSCDSAFINCANIGLEYMFGLNDLDVTIQGRNVTQWMSFKGNTINYIPKLPKMTVVELRFGNNLISSVQHKAFSDLKGLKTLDMSHNKLSSNVLNNMFIGSWDDKTNSFPLSLRHLNLCHNQITAINKFAFEKLSNLETIDLSHNPLKVINVNSHEAIASLKSLTYLNLANTGIGELHPEMMLELKSLSRLDLSENEFTNVPQAIGKVKMLTDLKLEGNKFKELNDQSFFGLESLKTLNLSHNNDLTAVKFGTFGHLKNLTILDLSFCQRLGDINVGAFNGMIQKENETDWKLKDIRLNNNALREISDVLCPWKFVTFRDFSNNPFSCDCSRVWKLRSVLETFSGVDPGLIDNIHHNISCAEPKHMKGMSPFAMSVTEINYKCQGGLDSAGYFDKSNLVSTISICIGVFLAFVVISAIIFIVWKCNRKILEDDTSICTYHEIPLHSIHNIPLAVHAQDSKIVNNA